MINIIGSDTMGLGDYAENQFIIMCIYSVLLILNGILYTWGKFRNRKIRNFIFNFQALAFLNIIIVGLILYFNVDEIMDKWILWSLFALINGIYLGIIEHHYKSRRQYQIRIYITIKFSTQITFSNLYGYWRF